MRRIILGALALCFLSVAGGIYLGDLADQYTLVMSVCMRMGLVLGALWLAYDQLYDILRRTPPLLMGAIVLCLVVIVVRPRAIVAVAPLLAAATALHYFGKLLKPLPDPGKRTKPSQPPDDHNDA